MGGRHPRRPSRASCQCLASRSRGFLDRSRVVVLMPRQRSAACEGLLTVGVRAFVRSLARVDASVPCQ